MDEELQDVVEPEVTEEFDKEFLDGFNEDDPTTDTTEDTTEDNEEPEEDTEDGETEPEKKEEPPEAKPAKTETDEEAKGEPEKDEEVKPPEPFKVFFLGKEIEVAQDEAVEWIQRGMNEKRMEEKFKQMEEDNKHIDSFLDIAAYYDIKPNELIKHAVEGYKNMEIQRFTEKGTPEEDAKELFNQRLSNAKIARANQPKPKGKERDIQAEIDELMRLMPDLRGMKRFPEEVSTEIAKGTDVKTAYLKHENKKLQLEKKALEDANKELEIKLKTQEQEKKVAKAPQSVRGAGASITKKDAFLVGFDSDY